MQETEKIKRLQQLAEQDEIYLTWKNSYTEATEKFTKIARWCPKNIRSILYSYADFGRVMNQRLVNLACKHMDFPDTDK